MISDNVVEEAKNSNVVDFICRYYGFTFKETYGSYRCKEHPSLAIASDCRGWAWHSQNLNGYGAISFLMKMEGLDFPKAVEEVVGYSVCQSPIFPVSEPSKVLQLPERGVNCNKTWYYLCNIRCLDPSIVDQLIVSGRIYQDIRSNVVFVGVDDRNVPKFACMRGTYPPKPFRKDCFGSDKAYSFNMTYGNPTRVFVFESPIDCISHGSFKNLREQNAYAYLDDARLSLGGVSGRALECYLKRFTTIKEIVFCLDNDEAGRRGAEKLAEKYSAIGYDVKNESPSHKDYNEMLVAELGQRNAVNV